ncbi:MAG: tetratricopeptide repeat protein, partial [Fimbriimonadaceae bacterium]|nr:tetratricopeptide repeat protein [Chitinophagales bacterium]
MIQNFSGRIFGIICICIFSVQYVHAQQTFIYSDPYRDYKTGLELYEQKKYSTAQQFFDLAATNIPDDAKEELFTYKTYAQYYSAICAIELNNPDAEKLMLDFVENYPGNALQGAAYFQLGNIFFKKKQYADALAWYDKVDIYDLDRVEVDKYRFQYAYCLFTKKRLDEAKKLFLQLRDKEGPYYYPTNYYYGFIEYYEEDYDEALKYFDRVKGEEKYSTVIPYYICNIYYQKGQYDELIAYAEPLINNTKLSYYEEINQLIGQAYFYKKDYKKALPYLQYYIEKSRNERPEDYYQLGYAQYKLNDIKTAAESLEEASGDNDTLTQQAMYVLGDCYIKLKKKDDARNAFMEASRTDIDKKVQENALFNYGKLSYELEYYPAAVTALTDYLKKYPKGSNKTEAQEILAEALLNSNDYEEAIEVIDNISDKSPKLKAAYQRVTYYRGVQLFNEENYESAEKMFVKSSDNKIDDALYAATYFWLGEINYNRDKYQLSISDHLKFQDLSKVAKNLPKEATAAFSNYTLGYNYFKTKNYANAAKYFEKTTQTLKVGKTASQENEVALDASLRLGDCYFMTKNYDKAETSYKKIIDNNYKGSDYALYQKGMLHGLQKENTSKISSMQQLVKTYSTSNYVDDALYEIANTYFITGKNQDAIDGFKKLISEKPNSNYTVKAYLKLGLIYYNLGDYETSEEYYKKAYELSPNTAEGEEAREALKDLATKTGDVSDLEGIVTKSEKDSIIYTAAKNKYDAEDYRSAVGAFDEYLKQFPKGYFRIDA